MDNLAKFKDELPENKDSWSEKPSKKSAAEDELDASRFEPELDSEELPNQEESIETPEVSESNETDTEPYLSYEDLVGIDGDDDIESMTPPESSEKEPYLSYEELLGLDAPEDNAGVSKDRYLEPEDLMPELAEKAPASELPGMQTKEELEKGVPTGGAAGMDDSKKMTIGAKLQAFGGKLFGVGESHPEQEYYKISLNLANLKESKELPSWFTKHNELMTVQDVKNESLNTSIKETVARAKNVVADKLDQNLLDKTDVVVSKPNSPLTRIATQSPDLRNFVEKHIEELKSGKSVSGSFEFQFETAEDAGEIKKNKASMSKTLHNTNVSDMKMNKDGTVSMVLVDYYDFAPGGGNLNNNAYKQQENGVLQNYVLVVPIRFRL